MSATYDFYPQYTDSNCRPLAGGRVLFREQGSSTTARAVYSDIERTILAESTQHLGADGRYEQGPLYPIPGVYTIFVQRRVSVSKWETLYSADVDFMSIPTPASVGYDSTVAALETPGSVGSLIYIAGYFEVNDGGQGWWAWDPSWTGTADGGSVIQPGGSGVGAWLRIFENGDVRAEQWGAIPNQEVDNTTALTSAMLYATNTNRRLRYFSGTYYLSGSLVHTCDVALERDVLFRSLSTGSVDFQKELTVTGTSTLVHFTVELLISGKQRYPLDPRWYGTPGGIISDSSAGFARVVAGSAGQDILISRDYMFGNNEAVDFSNNRLIFTDDGYFEIEAGAILAFGNIEAAGRCFRGVFNASMFVATERIQMRWFLQDIGTVPLAFNSYIDSFSQRVLYFENVAGFTFTHPQVFTPACVFNNCTFDSTEKCIFYSVTSIDNTPIFTGTVPSIVGGTADPRWFGAIVWATDNTTALQSALDSCSVVDLAGHMYQFESTLNMTNREIKNGRMTYRGSTTGFNIVGNANAFTNMIVENISVTYAGALLLFSLSGQRVLKISRSTISVLNAAARVFASNASSRADVSITDSVVQIGDLMQSTSAASLIRYTITNSTIRSFNTAVRVMRLYSFCRMHQCRLEAVRVVITDSAVSNNVIKSLSITDCVFVRRTAATYTCIEELNVAVAGHQATIRECYEDTQPNYSGALVIPQTQGYKKLAAAITLDSSLQADFFVWAVLARNVDYVLPGNLGLTVANEQQLYRIHSPNLAYSTVGDWRYTAGGSYVPPVVTVAPQVHATVPAAVWVREGTVLPVFGLPDPSVPSVLDVSFAFNTQESQ